MVKRYLEIGFKDLSLIWLACFFFQITVKNKQLLSSSETFCLYLCTIFKIKFDNSYILYYQLLVMIASLLSRSFEWNNSRSMTRIPGSGSFFILLASNFFCALFALAIFVSILEASVVLPLASNHLGDSVITPGLWNTDTYWNP